MIIQALHRYYQILAEDEKSQIPLYGYCNAKVGYALNISEEGELLDIFPLKEENKNGKKLIPKIFTVPEQKVKSSNIAANFMCGNSTYVLGMDNKSDSQRLEETFKSFKELHYQVLGCAKGRAAKAILAFLKEWDISKARQNDILQDYIEDILKGSNLVFRLDGEMGYLHDDSEIKKLWEEYNSKNRENDIEGQCLVTGETTILSKIHPKITNIKGTFSGGASIVSFNDQAYTSFGKEQNYNAPIGKYAAFTYTTVLKYMLSNVKHKIQKIQIGDATTVFWAESPSSIYLDLAGQLINPIINEETDTNNTIEDIKIKELVQNILQSAKSGKEISANIEKEINPQTKFYILGLSPNAGRISVRFFHRDTFGGFIKKISSHYRDMQIIKESENNKTDIPIKQILWETIPPKSKVKEAQPLLAGAIMRSIITGGMYHQSLYHSILQRVKMDSEIRVNYTRASIIKAYLLRKFNITKNYNLKEGLTVALNEQITNIAYLLGRLFAILEKTQKDAGNETIRTRYFASAMTTPKVVFPILLRLAQHYISKIEYGYINDKRIENIIKEIDYFPSYLSLDEQGVFILGYYHQRVKLWEKKVKENVNLKEEN
jgi:CRISPR-associated protein Csd1